MAGINPKFVILVFFYTGCVWMTDVNHFTLCSSLNHVLSIVLAQSMQRMWTLYCAACLFDCVLPNVTFGAHIILFYDVGFKHPEHPLPTFYNAHIHTPTPCPYKHSNHKRIPTGCCSHTSQNGPFHTAPVQEWEATYLSPLDSLDTLLYTTFQFILSKSCFVFRSFLYKCCLYQLLLSRSTSLSVISQCGLTPGMQDVGVVCLRGA